MAMCRHRRRVCVFLSSGLAPRITWVDPHGVPGLVSPSAMMKSYLWVADPRQVTFLWSDKEKSPKEIRPGRFAAPNTRGALRASRRDGAPPAPRAVDQHAPART